MIRRSIRSLCGILLFSGCTSIPSSIESILSTIVYNPKSKITYEQASRDSILSYEERKDLNLLNKIQLDEKGRYLQAVEWVSLWLRVSMEDVDRSLSWGIVNVGTGRGIYEPFFSRDLIGKGITIFSGSRLTNEGDRVLVKYEVSPNN